jgi:hypothetical protein
MHGRWFRFYDSVVDDPKVQRLSLSAFRFWVNVLCLASRNGGKLPPLVDLTFSLRMTEKQVVDGLKSLEAAGLVDESVDGVSTPHNWNGRQFKADVSTERVKRFRETHQRQNRIQKQRQNRKIQSQRESGPHSPTFFRSKTISIGQMSTGLARAVQTFAIKSPSKFACFATITPRMRSPPQTGRQAGERGLKTR